MRYAMKENIPMEYILEFFYPDMPVDAMKKIIKLYISENGKEGWITK